MRPHLLRAARGCALLALLTGAVSVGACAEDFATAHKSTARLSLGDDVYSVVCDRVAASEHPEDLEGRYSHDVCHADESGNYASDYGPTDGDMPPRVATMVRYRQDFVDAINAMFPDKDSMQEDMRDLLKALTPLYDDDTIPESTRTLAAIMDAIGYDPAKNPDEDPAVQKAKATRAKAAQAALARLGGRKGYRSESVGVGLARPMMAYPKLADVVDTAIHKLGPGGDAEPQLRKLLEAVQAELDSTVVSPARPPIATYLDRFAGKAGQHAKLSSEILENLLVDGAPLKGDLTGPAYAPTWTDPYARDGLGGVAAPTPFLRRDPRGYAWFTALPADAQDKDGDGLADVDPSGRFLDKTGKPLAVGTPFAQPVYVATGKDLAARDAVGRALVAPAGPTLYRYGDASKTMLHSVLVDARTLTDPANGALLDLTHAALYQLGPRSPADKKDPTTGPDSKKYTLGDGTTVEVRYRKFDAAQSPIADLLHATGAFLQYPKAADYFELGRQLFRDHPHEVARVLGAALKIRDLANDPAFASVNLGQKSALWDDFLAVAVKIASEPDLLHDVLEGLADDDVLLLSRGMTSFFGNKDELDYDPAADTCWGPGAHPDATCAAINNPSFNVSKGAVADPATPTDLSKPDAEGNRSLFQRFASLIHDASGVRACNKAGAKIDTKLLGFGLSLPLFGGSYKECEVLDVPDLAVFYVGCIAGGINEATGNARCLLPVSDPVVSAMKGILGNNAVDTILESSSGITGLTQVPTIQALNRLVFWRNPNKFIDDLTAPIPTSVCPITDPATTHRTCASDADLMWNRQRATIFMGEYFDALKALRPIVTPFAKKRGADKTGREQLFIDLVTVMHEHWSRGTNPTRCGDKKSGDPKYCAGDDVRQYEALVAKAFATDLLPALNGLQKVVRDMSVRGQPGTDVMVAMVNDLINPNNAKGLSLTDRKKNKGTTTNDGRPIEQVTPFYLFADALNAMDAQWVGSTADADHALWRAARGKLVDQFLAVDTTDPAKAALRNQAVAAAMPIVIDLLEDRVEQHKAQGDLGKWATGDLAQSFVDSLNGPLFASIMDLQEALYTDPKSRQTLGSLLTYLADKASTNEALATTVTVVQDLMQVVGDESNMVPIYHALAVGAAPDGASKRALDMIERIRGIETSDDWKQAHDGRRVLPKLMANAVTPMGKDRPSPIEVLIDCATDVNRADASSTDPFAADDFGAVGESVHDFLVDPYRGLEQFYAIVKQRKVSE